MDSGRTTLIAEALLDRTKPQRDEWWRGAMFYEVYLRSFRDSDGDGIGDLKGVTAKLDYISSLNVDGLWLSPFYPSPQIDFGYDITDLTGVDPLFGTLDDFTELLEQAHRRDLALLIDIVPCHTSDRHEWFEESRRNPTSPKGDWYIWADSADDGGPPNNWLSSFGGPAWTWEPRRSQYFYHPFLPCQPALNLQNPETLAAMLDVFRFWMAQGVDGFRLDAVQCLTCDPLLRSNPPCPSGDRNPSLGGGSHNPFRKQLHYFDRDVPEAIPILTAIRAVMRESTPECVAIGELADVDSSRAAVKYTKAGTRLHAVYDFDLIHRVKSVCEISELLEVRNAFLGSGESLNVFTNHDSTRAVSNLTDFAVEAGRAEEASKLLLFLQATLRGGAILFQGDELGLTQPRLDYEDLQDPWGKTFWPDFEGRDGVRTPIPWRPGARNAGFSDAREAWLPVPEDHAQRAVAVQDKDAGSVLNFLRDLLAWRREYPMLRNASETVARGHHPNLVVFDRSRGTCRLTFVANISLDPATMTLEKGDTLLDLPSSDCELEDLVLKVPGLSFAAIRR